MAQFFMEWLRGAVVTGGADVYGETELKTPVGRANNLAMAIHEVNYEIEPMDLPASLDGYSLQLALNTKTESLHLNSSDALALWGKSFSILTEGAEWLDLFHIIKFYPPILYAKSSIYFGLDTVGQGGAKNAYTRIGYTLRYVSPTRMVQALVD